VLNVTVNGRPLDDNRKYTLATTNFVAVDGGDGYTMFKGAPLLIGADRAPIDADVLTKRLTTIKVIAPKVEGRIKRLDQARSPEANCKE
jgi:5'-nucleotidase